MASVFDDERVQALLDLALREDLGAGDRTTEATVPAEACARGRLLAKAPLVVCGLDALRAVFERIGPGVDVELLVGDGHRALPGEVVARAAGPARVLLAGERLMLNLLQHLSGVATATRQCVERVAGTQLVIRDTRKTVPGMRVLAKYAVRVGGGENHRMALDDAILVKDNHLALGGGDLLGAVRAARTMWPALPLEVECRTMAELDAAVAAEPDLILLDNMTTDQMAEAVRRVAGRVPLEASGGIALDDLAAVAATGVDYVAMGALTHSAPAVDLSFKLEPLA